MDKLFEVLTDKERRQAENNFKKDYNRVKNIVARVAEVTIKKGFSGKVGVDKSNCIYPMKDYQNIIKIRQKYKLYLNEYERIIRIERIK